MLTVILILIVVACLLLTLLVLIQNPQTQPAQQGAGAVQEQPAAN